MVPSTAPLQRCIPVLTVTLRSPCSFHSFLPTASIFTIFLAVFRKAIIRMQSHNFHWFLNGNDSHPFLKENLCNAGNSFSFPHSSGSPSQLGLPGCHQALPDYSASGQNISQPANYQSVGLHLGLSYKHLQRCQIKQFIKERQQFHFLWRCERISQSLRKIFFVSFSFFF